MRKFVKKNVSKFLRDLGYFLLTLGRAVFDRFPFLRSCYHFFLAFFGNILYWFPSRKIKVIGITGTNGKTTTLELVAKIFEEAGYRVASISSIKFKIGDKEWENLLRMTLPGRFKLQRFLRRAVNAGCQYAVLEVTSEGILQHRHRFVAFDVAVLTNLSPEHIEAHGSFENYKRAKGELFKNTKNIHVINLDDKNANYFLKFKSQKIYGYRISRGPTSRSDLEVQPRTVFHREEAENVWVGPSGIKFSVGDIDFSLKLLGEFNIYNALAAICVGLSQGIDLKNCKRALERFEGIPGRMEIVIEKPFKVIVDYAFTPNALRQVYKTIKNNFSPKKMICVLGACGGGRDKWKRPVLGEIAAKHCEEVIITNEDPYDEDPVEIINQVAKGAERVSGNQLKPRVYKILERREAIKKSLELARPGDTVIITGKGCEPSICLAGGKRIPWDDRRVAREEFEKINK